MRAAFERWANENIGQFRIGDGYYGTLGVFVYNHNIAQLCWEAWQVAYALGGENA